MHKLFFLVCFVLSSVLTNSGHVEALPVSDANQLSQSPFQNPWTKQPLIFADSDPTQTLDVGETTFDSNSTGNSTIETASCSLCKAIVRPLRRIMFSNTSRSLALSTGVTICKLFRINTPNLCEHLIPVYGPWALTVLSHTFFEPEHFCGLAGACPKQEPRFAKWEITLPEKRVESELDRTEIEDQSQEDNEEGEDVMTILHLSDWHFDPQYREGYDADCDEPLCCRIPPSNPAAVKNPAGKWGDFRCDSPRSLITNMLEFIPTVVPHLDMVVTTGDQPPHDVWLETVDSMLNVTRATTSYMESVFKNKVFPTLGNHDTIPANSFPTSRTKDAVSNQWVYDEFSEQWSAWLPNSTKSSLRAKGGYSAVAAPGLKIISLNTNFFYRLNWWMLMRPRDEPDPERILGWLVEELQKAEDDGDKVLVIGHMSPVHGDADPILGRQFARVVSRYRDVIAGQFYGHSHFDEFQVLYDIDKQRRDNATNPDPVHVAYLGPSITPFTNLNPAFRVYKYSRKTYRLLNHYTYSFNLTEANKPGNEPQWHLLYDAKNTYNLKDMSPGSWHDLTAQFLESPEDALTEQMVEQTIVSNGKTPMDLLFKYSKLATRNASHRFNCGQQSPILSENQGSISGEKLCRRRAVCQLRGGRSGPYSATDLCKPISGKPMNSSMMSETTVMSQQDEDLSLQIAGVLVGWEGMFSDESDQDRQAACRS